MATQVRRVDDGWTSMLRLQVQRGLRIAPFEFALSMGTSKQESASNDHHVDSEYLFVVVSGPQ